MQIRLLKRWGEHPAGTILEPGRDELAQELIDLGFAMAVKRKRGRPRKKKPAARAAKRAVAPAPADNAATRT
jgi:hypothetical protein